MIERRELTRHTIQMYSWVKKKWCCTFEGDGERERGKYKMAENGFGGISVERGKRKMWTSEGEGVMLSAALIHVLLVPSSLILSL